MMLVRDAILTAERLQYAYLILPGSLYLYIQGPTLCARTMFSGLQCLMVMNQSHNIVWSLLAIIISRRQWSWVGLHNSSSPSTPARRTGTTRGKSITPISNHHLSLSRHVSAGCRRELAADQIRRWRRRWRSRQSTKEHCRMRHT